MKTSALQNTLYITLVLLGMILLLAIPDETFNTEISLTGEIKFWATKLGGLLLWWTASLIAPKRHTNHSYSSKK